jgi:thioredoxin 1
MGSKTLNVTSADFETKVLKSDVPVLVDFWAEWCGPCRMIAPIVDEIAAEYDGKLRVVKVDTDKDSQIASAFGVLGLPTLMLFKNGKPVESIMGYKPKGEIVKKLRNHV